MLLSNLDILATAPGGVARLRELILTLAVQGKLVPQDPADEPASVLLQKIRAEKDRLIAEGKIKRDKPLAPITEEEKPFELPVGWEWVRIPEVSYSLGQGEPISPFSYIDVAAIDNLKGLITADVQVVEAADAPSRARKNVCVGTVIYSTVRPYLKNIALVEREYQPRAIASTAFAVMHPHTGVVSKFLLHYLRSQPFTDFVNAKAVGVAYPAINDANFFQGLIALPPTAEQSRIVTRVEELMRLCDALEAKGKLEAAQHAQLVSTLLGTLTASTTPQELAEHWQRVARHFDLLLDRPAAIDALEQTLLQLAVRGLLVPQDPSDEPASELLKRIRTEKDRLMAEGKIKRDKPLPPITDEEKPFELPVGWEWVSVATVFDTTSGNTFDLGMEKKAGIYMYVKVGDMNLSGNEFEITTSSRFINPDEKTAKALIPSGSIIFPKRGGAIATNKKRVVKTPIFVDLNTMAITPVLVLTEYALLWLTTIDLASLNTGTSVPQINHKDIDPLPFPLPPAAEQSRIVARVTALRRLCADLRQRLAEREAVQSRLAEALVASVA